ncbi:MAG: SRPBCC family protein [Aeromicrobium sp.]|uniref:SRPBCC family protein n=1 Tax=Aeromicrobium sp. TaxID=1871063 RepID=UPI0039E61EEA
MTAPTRVRLTQVYSSSPEEVFDKLAEHENLGPVLGANIKRLKDGDTERNGVGSARTVKIGPLPGFVETTVTADRPTLIEYQITQGSPLRGHWGRQELAATADGGTRLDYTIGFDAAVPGLAPVVAKILTVVIGKGLPKLCP